MSNWRKYKALVSPRLGRVQGRLGSPINRPVMATRLHSASRDRRPEFRDSMNHHNQSILPPKMASPSTPISFFAYGSRVQISSCSSSGGPPPRRSFEATSINPMDIQSSEVPDLILISYTLSVRPWMFNVVDMAPVYRPRDPLCRHRTP